MNTKVLIYYNLGVYMLNLCNRYKKDDSFMVLINKYSLYLEYKLL